MHFTVMSYFLEYIYIFEQKKILNVIHFGLKIISAITSINERKPFFSLHLVFAR